MTQSIPTRDQVPVADTWKLEDLFADHDQWEAEFTQTREKINAYADTYRGTLSQSPAALLAALEASSAISLSIERLYCYAHMRRDEDNGNSLYQGMTDRAAQLAVSFSEAEAFSTPEIMAMEEAKLDAFIDDPVLALYRHGLDNIRRLRKHVLSEKEERLLALAADPLGAVEDVFTMLNDVDIDLGTAHDAKGNPVKLSHGNFRNFLESSDRAVRKEAFETFYAAFHSLRNTFAATYAASVKGDVFAARARGYAGALEAALYGNNVPLSVYDGLIQAVESRLGDMERYLNLRKKALGLSELHMYDLYVPMVPDAEEPMSYPEMQQLVMEALSPMGERYVSLLKRAFDERWIDVYENKGKTSGAFSWGAYGTHPYVLLNTQPKLDYAFTVAHELGHALHSYHSDETQAYPNAQYRIMCAEVASTVNEVLLLRHLLNKETDPKKKAFLINYFLEQFRTTVYRQTMFAAFERKAHRMCESGEPLNADTLSAAYRALNEAYYPGVVIDEQIDIEWLRIPHFYNAFYVYQYATGFCTAVAIARDILEGGGSARYLDFLRSGGSDYPIELLKKAGVDLTKPESILSALDVFAQHITQLEELI